ncbi:hypothetical protein [Vibrio sp. CAU 1672]|uniref:hypothetical protein n=1 Tax=Vibrio sp. CAU 1672 TaxID=3032594 RepID=UPI0023DB7706|nr:hypothetical protein [Vibrio sp. CAU 1672]MDF2155607.1 hypothetical protein [Vibrio sp. CAU 1672]
MTMICAKEFAEWLRHRFCNESVGVSISRQDINQLTGRQRLDPGFISDVHYELMQHGMAFVTDTCRETFYLIPISQAKNWRDRLESHFEKDIFCNIYPIEKSG